jgi:hypothetical protein
MKHEPVAIFETRADLHVCAVEFGTSLKGATAKAGGALGAVGLFGDISNYAAAAAVAGFIAQSKTNPKA